MSLNNKYMYDGGGGGGDGGRSGSSNELLTYIETTLTEVFY